MQKVDDSCDRQEKQTQTHWRAPAVPFHGREAVLDTILGIVPLVQVNLLL